MGERGNFMNILRLKWYGTATILLEYNGTEIVFDPFFPLNKKSFQPRLEEISPDGLFATHCHFDHISAIPTLIEQSSKVINVYCTGETQDILAAKGVENSQICRITPGDAINIGPFEIQVLKSKHIHFNTGLILKTLFNPRILFYWNNFKQIYKDKVNRNKEIETIAFNIRTPDKRILLLGSLNLDSETEYEPGADLLILPYQGRTDLSDYALPFIYRLKPMKILLYHFDNTFPPFSSPVKTKKFVHIMKKDYPNIPIICTKASADWIDI